MCYGGLIHLEHWDWLMPHKMPGHSRGAVVVLANTCNITYDQLPPNIKKYQ